ncbi:putative 3-hydroxyacyl-CoA dehydrogenase [Hesseltinella vesiculosa]|uniref:Putative 3-hydroxyacyl-CoA dehydrogenase n=1 Tax=Hesseltinella vesiculosa TaxID=101127 RepID=A0A1X2GY28_9FUNG|nr:putative 3-hydroxyacyl-CoA dehydrogenase [Hesseltinella vesiculosa]
MKLAQGLVIVTGGSGGLGEQTIHSIVAENGYVALIDVNVSGSERIVEKYGEKRVYFPGPVDVANEEQVAAAMEMIDAHFVDVTWLGAVICSGVLFAPPTKLGYGPKGKLTSFQQFKHVMDINLLGTYNVAHKVSEQLIKSSPLNEDGERGMIITVSSITGLDGSIVGYGTSKAAVAGLTLPLARELSTFGIRVVSIAPGPFETSMIHVDADIQAPVGLFPKRYGYPHEFAELVVYAFKQRMLNGCVIRLDGGLRA